MTTLTSTDPKDILNAARCFVSCVPPGMNPAIKTYLLDQAVNGMQGPCVAPTAPVMLGVFAGVPPNSSLFVQWSQPANAGSLISTYTVQMGTTPGGPYTLSATVGAGVHAFAFMGLDSGTTYYAIVTANSTAGGGCSSAHSAEGSGTTTGTCSQGSTDSAAWAARVVANGGAAPAQSTKDAIAAFVCGLIADGIYSKFLAMNVIAPDSLIAAYTPLIVGPGLSLWTDPSPGQHISISANGLVGASAFSAFVRTGVKCTDFTSPQNTAWCVYVYTASNTGYSGGSYNETKGIIGAAKNGGNSTWFTGAFPGNGVTVASPGNGFYSDIRVSATDHRLFFFNSLNPHAQIGATDATNWAGTFLDNADGMILFAINDILGSQQLFSDDIISFVGWAQNFTSANSAALAARVQTLRTSLGGGFR